MQLWQQIETALDGNAALHPLPVNARRTGSSKASGYATSTGRHLVIARRGSSHVRCHLEPFDTAELHLPDGSVIEHLSATQPRSGAGRASERLRGPTEGEGRPAVIVKVKSQTDLERLLKSYAP